MILDLYRYSSQSITTLGSILIDQKFYGHTVEDRHQDIKVKHQTRIPAGSYQIKLREFGGHYEKYKNKYDGHKGMLWLQDVPEFTDILIHIGNTHKDSSGCILINNEVNNNKTDAGKGTRSTKAYLALYFKVLTALENNEAVNIRIHDLDTPYGK